MTIRLLTLILCMSVTSAYAKSVSENILDLDPNIIAAANCNGAIFAGSMLNYENGILNEERARIMLRSTTLAFWVTATKYQSIEHLRKYAVNYDEFFSDSYESVYDDLIDGNYTWESQAEMDICTARILDSLTSVSSMDLEQSGIDNYDQFKAILFTEADERFDYMLKLMEAMR